MAQKTKIEWTDMTWNPVRGCSRTPEGCRHCYAERMAARFSGPGRPYEGLSVMSPSGPRWTNTARCLEESVEEPLRWRRPRRVFVNSMSDLFHEDVPAEFIQRVFGTMNRAHWHRFQVLTKRSRRLRALSPALSWTRNIWMGVSVEDADHVARILGLRHTGARIKFLSLEPLLGPLPSLNLTGIDWVMVGGESGPGARPLDPAWVREIRDQCRQAAVPFFFKQWGGVHKKHNGRVLDGRTWDQVPRPTRTVFKVAGVIPLTPFPRRWPGYREGWMDGPSWSC
jgi:protein gp37